MVPLQNRQHMPGDEFMAFFALEGRVGKQHSFQVFGWRIWFKINWPVIIFDKVFYPL